MSNTITTPLDAAVATMKLVDQAIAAPSRRRVISLEVARHVLHHLGDTNWGIAPGDFETRLMRTIDAADDENRALLATVYPEHVIGLRDGRKHWGLDWLRTVVSEIVPAEPTAWEAAGDRLDAIAAETDGPRIGGSL